MCKLSESWNTYLLFSCPHESISSDGSIDTGYDDVDQSDILDLIWKTQQRHTLVRLFPAFHDQY